MKSITRLKQMAVEKVKKGEKTELAAAIQELDHRFVLEKTSFENIIKRSEEYINVDTKSAVKQLELIRDGKDSSSKKDAKKSSKNPSTRLGLVMLEAAAEIGDNTTLGMALHIAGTAQMVLADQTASLETSITEKFLIPLYEMLDGSFKQISKATKCLSGCRLDVDAAKGRVHAIPEGEKKDRAREELDRMKEKFEESQCAVQSLLLTFQETEADRSELLIGCLEAQYAFFSANAERVGSFLEELRTVTKTSGSAVFGRSLQETAEETGLEIPYILETCVRAIRILGCDTEGVFRLSGSAGMIKMLRSSFNVKNSNVDLMSDQWDIHAITGTLKLYFRTLPDPLFTYDLYDEWIRIGHIPDENRTDKLYEIKDMLARLPKENYETLKYLMGFLNELVAFKETTKMGSANFGIVFGPTLLQTRGDDMSVVMDTSAQGSVVEHLCENFHWCFDVDADKYSAWVQREIDIVNANSNNVAATGTAAVDSSKKEHVRQKSLSSQSSHHEQSPGTLRRSLTSIMGGGSTHKAHRASISSPSQSGPVPVARPRTHDSDSSDRSGGSELVKPPKRPVHKRQPSTTAKIQSDDVAELVHVPPLRSERPERPISMCGPNVTAPKPAPRIRIPVHNSTSPVHSNQPCTSPPVLDGVAMSSVPLSKNRKKAPPPPGSLMRSSTSCDALFTDNGGSRRPAPVAPSTRSPSSSSFNDHLDATPNDMPSKAPPSPPRYKKPSLL